MVIWRALIFLVFIPRILSWGEEGHFATCKIAEGYLTKDALAAVKTLLPESAEGDLANVCSWADEIKNTLYGWSSALHFADTPDYRCNYNYCRDCHDTSGNKDRCLTGAMYNYTQQLMSVYDGSNLEINYNLTEALMFLSHFTGDAHQPLHMGFLGDLGGNSITIQWYQTKTNLHKVWDDMIIESALEKFYGSNLTVMIQAIQKSITDSDIQNWENCDKTVCPDLYASESIRMACKYAYRNATSGSTVGDDYFLSRLPVVKKRLAQGGVRLAAVLNRIFRSNPSVAAL